MNLYNNQQVSYKQEAAISLDPKLLKKNLKHHKITSKEFDLILSILHRAPTMAELGVFSAMWSEHCSYKSSKIHLKKLPSTGEKVLVGPGENAGVVRISDKLCVAFKMESHNHPSFIEPYQGAATGVGGILRDVFCMGARPIANLNCLRFGEKKHPKTKWLMSNVVKGIGDYGNCVGIPTVGGNISFDPSYNGNILVNAMSVGIISSDKIFKGYASGVGNLIYYLGSATGRDGIHGATMASDSFKKEEEEQRTAVQVGDPFFEKLLLEATLEVLDNNLVIGIQDMGAAGLTSSIFEMASRAQTGVLLDLDKIPTRTKSMTPYELLLSESQERMLMVVEKDKQEAIEAIFKKWGLSYSQIGSITSSKRVQAFINHTLHVDIPVDSIVENAPIYHRDIQKPQIKHKLLKDVNTLCIKKIKKLGINHCIKIILNDLINIESIYEQYDHHIGTRTVIGPEGGGASVLWLKSDLSSNNFLGLSISTACNENYCLIDPKEGAKHAVYKAARMIAATGSKPSAITDCLNYGNPEDPEVMWQLSQGVEGIKDACLELSVPVVSGNVSLYNETDGKSISPTPMIGMIGSIEDIRHATPAHSKEDGFIFILQPKKKSLSFVGSHLAKLLDFSKEQGPLPLINQKAEKESMSFLSHIIAKKGLIACKDANLGGIITCLLKMTSCKKQIVFLDLTKKDIEEFLFAERNGTYLALVSKDNMKMLEEESKKLKHNTLNLLAQIKTNKASVVFNSQLTLELDQLAPSKNLI